VNTPWMLRGRTGRLIDRWMVRHGWELHRIVYAESGVPLARVHIRPGHTVRLGDVIVDRAMS
jgi:hypothetical protein